jgi:hypothetical protein
MSNIGLGGAQYVVFWWVPVDKWLLVRSYQQRHHSIKLRDISSVVRTSGESTFHSHWEGFSMPPAFVSSISTGTGLQHRINVRQVVWLNDAFQNHDNACIRTVIFKRPAIQLIHKKRHPKRVPFSIIRSRGFLFFTINA